MRDDFPAAKPGTVVTLSLRLIVSCGEQALEIVTGQTTTACTFRARSWRSLWVWWPGLADHSARFVAIKRRTAC